MRFFSIIAMLVLMPVLIPTPVPASAPLEEPIVMMWQVHPDSSAEELAYLAAQGVTVTQSFAAQRRTDDELATHLAALRRHGLRMAYYLGRPVRTPSGCTYSADAIDRVRRFREDDTIAIWHTVDEPAGHDIDKECQEDLYRLVKGMDPDTPVMVSANNNRRKKYENYFSEDAFDILDLHYYVNPHVARGQRNLVEFFREFRRKRYPVIMTFRAFESPHKPKRKPMVAGGLFEQYDFFISEAGVTGSFGFYGWALSPNVGLNRLPAARREFEDLMRDFREGRL